MEGGRKRCVIQGCPNRAHARGWCSTHYTRWQKHGDPLATLTPRRGLSEGQRFWSQVDRREPDDCWRWTGALDPDGYGMFIVARRGIRAHRYAYLLANGTFPQPYCLHSCDTPSCVNPAHLFAGTQQDNITDMFAKNRQNKARGESHGQARLTRSDVERIRAALRSKETQRVIAERFGVTQSVISRIKTGEAWR